jgi:4-amino-4-deoxy-L-arabinose transferase-like glycosyltransferase
VVALVLLGLVARIVAALAIGGGFQFADEAVYVDTAGRLWDGRGFGAEYDRVPAYPVFIGLLSLWLPADLTFLRVAQAAIAALGGVLVFRAADRMFGHRAAIAAGVVYALDPLLVIGAGLLYPEAVAALLLPPIVLTAFDASERDRLGRSALVGGLLGLLALLRPVALVLPPVVGCWIGLTVRAGPWRRLAHLGVLGLAVLLVLAPWTARNFRVHGGLVPVATAGSHLAPGGQGEAPSDVLTGMARGIRSDPGAFLSRAARQFVQFWELAPTRMATDDPRRREDLQRADPRLPLKPLFTRELRDLVSAASFTLELALAFVGIVAVARTRWRQALLPVLVILAYAVGYAMLVAKLRYRMPVLPLLFLFTGAGIAAIYSLNRRVAYRSPI